MEEFRDKVYFWSLDLVEEGKKQGKEEGILQGIFLMLATWNFAYFRYHMKEFGLKNFKKILKKCDFDYFKEKKFIYTDLDEEEVENKIMEIYKDLSDIEGVGFVGATKIMHLMCPDFFMMWDTKIRKYYKVGTSPKEYLLFMKRMQEMYKNKKFQGLDTKDVTIPRAIDIYNRDNIPKS